MIPAIKAEFRKLFTVRSTYVMCIIAFLLIVLFAFYIEGLRADASVNNPGKLASEVTGAVGAVSIFPALIALLLFSHEYRYNTIAYTLTASNSRAKTLWAKVIAVSIFSILFIITAAILSPLLTYLGIQLKGVELVPQNIPYLDLLWRSVYVGWAYGMLGLLLVALVRNQIGAIVILLLGPVTIEGLLSLLLKTNTIYLPFSALGQVATNSGQTAPGLGQLSPPKAAMVFSMYLIGGWIVAWILFHRRDAS